MRSKPFDPLRLDVAAFAAEHAELQGEWPVGELPRLAQASDNEAADALTEPVRWRAHGEARARRAADPDVWLHLACEGSAWLQCQRCLQPLRVPLEVDRSFRFVRDEQAAEAEDLDSEEEVLALARRLDLRVLVEDELLLALPLVPRHEVCPQPLPLAQDPEPLPQPLEERPNPFAKLAELKRGKSSH